jgi:hypothetical protein
MGLNYEGIDAFVQGLQAEFDKRPIHIPVQAVDGVEPGI